MAKGRSDTRLIVVTTLGILVIGLLIAETILFVTGRAKNPDIKGSVPYGFAKPSERVKTGGPYAFAGKTGDSGFWIDLEHGRLVALKIKKPGTKDCNVRWRARSTPTSTATTSRSGSTSSPASPPRSRRPDRRKACCS